MICDDCGSSYDFPTQNFSAQIEDRRHVRLRKICRWNPDVPDRFVADIARLRDEYDEWNQAVLEAEYCNYFQVAEGSPLHPTDPPPLPDASEELLAWADENYEALMPLLEKAMLYAYRPGNIAEVLNKPPILWEILKR